jgi:hypothetical protein
MLSRLVSILSVASINLLVFTTLVFFSELALRAFAFEQSCANFQCDWSKITRLRIDEIRLEAAQKIGFTTPDPELGWVLTPGFNQIIDDPAWRRSTLSITSHGFRSNGANSRSSEDAIDPRGLLVVGDSYAFGAQVSDWETWPACLEREAKIPVYNAGVPGYGAAQSVRRAALLSEGHKYPEVLWEILVGHDFERDRLDYKSGFSKPSVIRDSSGLKWSDVSDRMRKGTKYNPNPPGQLAVLTYENSMLAKMFIDTALQWDMTGMNLTSVHPQAATKKEVIHLAFANFVGLRSDRKSILLQYKIFGWLQKDVLDERDAILEEANNYGIMVFDTMETVAKHQPGAIWDGHHTALGNEVVCHALMNWRRSEAFANWGQAPASLRASGL